MTPRSHLSDIGDAVEQLVVQIRFLLPEISDTQAQALIRRVDWFCYKQMESFIAASTIILHLNAVTQFFDNAVKLREIDKLCSAGQPTHDNVTKVANTYSINLLTARLVWDVVYEVHIYR